MCEFLEGPLFDELFQRRGVLWTLQRFADGPGHDEHLRDEYEHLAVDSLVFYPRSLTARDAHEFDSLVQKHGVNSAGRPWNDQANGFSKDITYEKGTLPRMDDLIERSNLITVAPQLSEQTCDRIIEIFRESAAKLELVFTSSS